MHIYFFFMIILTFSFRWLKKTCLYFTRRVDNFFETIAGRVIKGDDTMEEKIIIIQNPTVQLNPLKSLILYLEYLR